MIEAFCTLLPSPTISPSRAVTDRVERPSQLAENGRVGTRRGWAGDAALAGAAAAGGARRSPISRRLTSALTVMVARAFAVDAEQRHRP